MFINNMFNLREYLFFFKTDVVFFNQDIFLYRVESFFSKKSIVSDILNSEMEMITFKLLEYVDDLEKFDIYNRKYRLRKNIDLKKSKKKNISDSSFTSNNNTYHSIYDTTNGSLKKVKTWHHYLKGRYGFGKGLYKIFSRYNGTLISNWILLDKISIIIYQTNLKGFFLRNMAHFDHKKAVSSFYTFYRHRYRFTFKGWCYLNHYPVNGQKRRTNYKTTRNYNQLIVLKNKK